MKFVFMLNQQEPLLQTSINFRKDWDYLCKADSDQVSDLIIETLADWVKEEQKEQDIDNEVHKISGPAISSSAILTGQPAAFEPSITTPEQYEALTVQVWGAVKDAFQYQATLTELKSSLEEQYSAFGQYAEENIKFVPETNGLKAYCVDLTEKIGLFVTDVSVAYKYFVLDTRDSTELKQLTDALMGVFTTIDTLIREIQSKVLPEDWKTSDKYRLGAALKTGDGAEEEEKAYDDKATLNYVTQAACVNNAAWSLVQYVVSVEEQKDL